MSTLENDIETVRELVQRQEGCPDPTCSVCKSNRERGEAVERVIALAQQAERLLGALQKIDAVYAAAHMTHGGHLECNVSRLELAIEDVRDLIGPAPEAPAAPVPPDTRSEAEKTRAAEMFGVSTWEQLMGRSKRFGEDF
jgi:hypothetical protein